MHTYKSLLTVNLIFKWVVCLCSISLVAGFAQLTAQQPLSKIKAASLTAQLLQQNKELYKQHADSVWNSKTIAYGQYLMPFTCTEFGAAPVTGHSLYISLHGGGNVPAADNDQQWRNQQRLYTVKEGLYVAPRAPTNTWNLWHERHIDPMLDDLIGAMIVSRGVDPNRIYLTGYSAGGDGTYQLATRMADRWAAAAMMAGHPGDADIRNLRNLPFALFVGGLDSAYNRNGLGEQWGLRLDSLQLTDSSGFTHLVRVYPDKAHWMDRRDSAGVAWMAQFTRRTLPKKVMWVMDDEFEPACYWLATDSNSFTPGAVAVVQVSKNTIDISENSFKKLMIGLNDQLIDLNKPVEVRYQGKKIFTAMVRRSAAVIRETSRNQWDASRIFSARLYVIGGKVSTVDIP